MPRLPRIHVEGAIYYVTSKSSQNQQLFKEKADYQMYLNLLTKYKSQHQYRLFSYELLPDHLSLLIETREDLPAGQEGATISEIMHDLNSLYTKYYNAKYERRGSLFEARFRSVLVEKAAHLLEMTRFIHADKGDYNSYRVYVSRPEIGEPDISSEIGEVKNFLKEKDNPDAYEKYCLEAGPDDLALLEKKLKRGSVFGSDSFAEAVRGRIDEVAKERKDEGLSGTGKNRVRTVILIAGAVALVATSFNLYLYISKRDIESRYETLLKDKDVEFADQNRFENRSPISLAELDGTEWTLEIVSLPAGNATDTVKDKIRFQNGRFISERFGADGFRSSGYFLIPRGGHVVEWQTSQSTPSGDTMNWRTEWNGGLMKGVIEFRPKGGTPRGYSFFSTGWSYLKDDPNDLR